MPGIEEIPLHDFSGGVTERYAATEYTDRQWARIKGMVLESPAVLRSQWALQKIGTETGFKQIASIQGRLVGIKDNGWVYHAPYPSSTMTYLDTRSIVWTRIDGILGDDDRRILCTIPLRDESAEGFKSGLLLNSRESTYEALAIYVDGGAVTYKEWTDRYPNAVNGAPEENTMPRANVGTMWGDFLVLGDIQWYLDSSSSLTTLNSKPYEHALWFSSGGQVDHWDPIDVVFTTVRGRDNAVLDLIPIDAGLVVLTQGGIFLLRGTPDNYDVEHVRWGIASRMRDAAAYWPHTGAVVWVDNAGQVWHTNGEQFARLDEALFQERAAGADDHAYAFGEFVIVERSGRLFCFRAFDDDGCWTELTPPGGGAVRSMHHIGDQLYMLDSVGAVWRFNRRDPVSGGTERGHEDGVPIGGAVATRTMESGGGHDVTMWHRFGFRGQGPGTINDVTLRPGPALDAGQATMVHAVGEVADERDARVFPAHGPSMEASAEIGFSGDVAIEQVSWWKHRGRGDR